MKLGLINLLRVFLFLRNNLYQFEEKLREKMAELLK